MAHLTQPACLLIKQGWPAVPQLGIWCLVPLVGLEILPNREDGPAAGLLLIASRIHGQTGGIGHTPHPSAGAHKAGGEKPAPPKRAPPNFITSDCGSERAYQRQIYVGWHHRRCVHSMSASTNHSAQGVQLRCWCAPPLPRLEPSHATETCPKMSCHSGFS